jgi:hypothetical protein
MMNWKKNVKGNGRGLKGYRDICQKELRETTKILSHDLRARTQPSTFPPNFPLPTFYFFIDITGTTWSNSAGI